MSHTKEDKVMTATMTKERPILFTGAMVRAILAGTKTQTRRLVKPQPTETTWAQAGANLGGDVRDTVPAYSRIGGIGLRRPNGGMGFPEPNIRCPYGVPGERLWVRETFYCDHVFFPKGEPDGITKVQQDNGTWRHLTIDEKREDMRQLITYRADGEDGVDFEEGTAPWSSPIHMPRWASRLLLEVTDVRVQRLQDISEDDAIAEGLTFVDDGGAEYGIPGEAATWNADPRQSYRALWESINGAGSWDLNPWVWAVGFKRVTPQPEENGK